MKGENEMKWRIYKKKKWGLHPVKNEVLMQVGPALLCGTINLSRHIK